MNLNKTKLAIGLVALLTFQSHADTITGYLWKLSDVSTYHASPSLIPVTGADVSFTVNGNAINFNAGFAPTVSAFLSSGGATMTENTAGTLASQLSDGVMGTVIDIKGCITMVSGQSMTFTHDDGIYFSINGVDQGFYADPTSPYTETRTYLGPSGTFSFELVYTENHDGEAVLQTDLNLQSCPDGASTIALFGGALSLIGFLRRTRK